MPGPCLSRLGGSLLRWFPLKGWTDLENVKINWDHWDHRNCQSECSTANICQRVKREIPCATFLHHHMTCLFDAPNLCLRKLTAAHGDSENDCKVILLIMKSVVTFQLYTCSCFFSLKNCIWNGFQAKSGLLLIEFCVQKTKLLAPIEHYSCLAFHLDKRIPMIIIGNLILNIFQFGWTCFGLFNLC